MLRNNNEKLTGKRQLFFPCFTGAGEGGIATLSKIFPKIFKNFFKIFSTRKFRPGESALKNFECTYLVYYQP